MALPGPLRAQRSRSASEVRRRPALALLGDLLPLESLGERARDLFLVEAQKLLELLGAHAVLALLQRADDRLDDLRDLLRRAAGEAPALSPFRPSRCAERVRLASAAPRNRSTVRTFRRAAGSTLAAEAAAPPPARMSSRDAERMAARTPAENSSASTAIWALRFIEGECSRSLAHNPGSVETRSP